MPPLADTAMVVSIGLRISTKQLGDTQLKALLQAVAATAVEGIPGLGSDLVSVLKQETVSKGVTLVTFELASRGTTRVTVDAVKAIATDLVFAARSLGYTVADGAEESVSGRLVDAMCNYICGAGCSLCDDDLRCTWNLDCRSGICRDGLCHSPSSPPTNLTWLWVAVAATAAVAGTMVLCRYLRRRIHRHSQEALLTDMDDLENV
jgi:hypothetical protein